VNITADDLIAGLRRNGHRVTRARRTICEVLVAAPDEHLRAADISSRAGTGLDVSTVYRTLDALEAIGLVEHVHLGPGAGAYHVAPSSRHHHLVCEECGRAVDIPVGDVERAIESATTAHGFVAHSAHFVIVGRCEECEQRRD
jgi:Fur family ferric uptake transcriptional regulator